MKNHTGTAYRPMLSAARYVFGLLLLLINGAFAQVTDRAVYRPPDYSSFLPPPLGGIYEDPVFKTKIKRVSDATKMRDNAAGSGYVPAVSVEYSTMTPFNQDNSRLLLQHFSYYALYDGEGKYIKDLPYELTTEGEPRWSRTDPHVLYYRRDNQFKRLNVRTGDIDVVRTFSEYSSISALGESDVCFDGRHFVLAGDRRHIFVYDVATDTKSPVFDAGGGKFNSLYITPDDNVLVFWEEPFGVHAGIEMFDRNMNFIRRVAPIGGHMDVTRDRNGEEVLLWVNAADPNPSCENGVVKVNLSNASQTCLITFDWSLAAHVSAPDNSGWFFVETYAPGDPDPEAEWTPYMNEVLQIKLDGSEVRRLAHHRSRPFDTYNYMPRVSANRDGTRIIYSSNFGMKSIVERALDGGADGAPSVTVLLETLKSSLEAMDGYRQSVYTDTYMIEMPGDTAGSAIPGVTNAAVMLPSEGTVFASISNAGGLSTAYAWTGSTDGPRVFSAFAVLSHRENGVLVSEASIPARPLVRSARILASNTQTPGTGIVIANPQVRSAEVRFYFTNSDGESVREGVLTLKPNEQVTRFMSEAPFNGPPSFTGSFTLESSVPVALTALEGFLNERAVFLMNAIDVSDVLTTGNILFAAPPPRHTEVLPHFASGSGWMTEIQLVNRAEQDISGSIRFLSPGGELMEPAIAYSIAARSAAKITVPSTLPQGSGSVRVIPAPDSITPSAFARVMYKPGDVVLTVAGISSAAGNSVRTYVQASDRTQSGVALANTGDSPLGVSLDLVRSDGSVTQTAEVNLPPGGQTARLLNELFPQLASPFSGILRATAGSPGVSLATFRTRYNERDEFILTTTPALPGSTPRSELYLPYIVTGGGYSTTAILFSGDVERFDGAVRLFSGSGESLQLQ